MMIRTPQREALRQLGERRDQRAVDVVHRGAAADDARMGLALNALPVRLEPIDAASDDQRHEHSRDDDPRADFRSEFGDRRRLLARRWAASMTP